MKCLLVTLIAVLAELFNMNTSLLVKARGHHIGLNGLEINVCDFSLITIENLSHFFESRSAGLNVKEEDEYELEEDPDLRRC
jgi:hypothetical protein